MPRLPLRAAAALTSNAPAAVESPALTCARLLEEELDRRVVTDAKYSLRRFATELEVSPAFLSLVLKGERRVNESRARAMAGCLKLAPKLTALFVALARAESASDDASRAVADAEVERLAERAPLFQPVKLDVFKMISRWYHTAIYALAGCDDFVPDPRVIAKRLRIQPMEADLALGRLLRYGLLKVRDGRTVQGAPGYSTGDVPSDAIRAFHKQVLALATEAVDGQAPESRDLSAVTLAVDPEQLPELRDAIKAFRGELTRLAAKGKNKRGAYQLAVQLFRLDRG